MKCDDFKILKFFSFKEEVSPNRDLVESMEGKWSIRQEGFTSNPEIADRNGENLFFIPKEKLDVKLKINNITLDIIKLQNVKFIMERLLNSSLRNLRFIHFEKNRLKLIDWQGYSQFFDLTSVLENNILCFEPKVVFQKIRYRNELYLKDMKDQLKDCYIIWEDVEEGEDTDGMNDTYMEDKMILMEPYINMQESLLTFRLRLLLPNNKIFVGAFPIRKLDNILYGADGNQGEDRPLPTLGGGPGGEGGAPNDNNMRPNEGEGE